MQKEKAKRFLADALMRLMSQKPYEKISVSELCSAAYLSRASFYKHFDSKDGLLCYQFRTAFCGEYEKAAAGDMYLRLADALSTLTSYTRIISEQRLLSKLLPELAAILHPNTDAGCEQVYQVCCAYLVINYITHNAPWARKDAMRYLQGSEELEQRIWAVSMPEMKDNAKKLEAVMLESFREGIPLPALSVKELTGRAGMNRSSFYRLFSDPRDMFMQCLRRFIVHDASQRYNKNTVAEHYASYSALLDTAWAELGIEGFAGLYARVLNDCAEPTDTDVSGNGLYTLRLRSVCFAAKRTALLYSFL